MVVKLHFLESKLQTATIEVATRHYERSKQRDDTYFGFYIPRYIYRTELTTKLGGFSLLNIRITFYPASIQAGDYPVGNKAKLDLWAEGSQ